MALLHMFIYASPPQVSLSHGTGVTDEFVKLSTTPRGKSGINLHAQIFGTIHELDVLQDNYLKTTTQSAFHFGAYMPLSYAEMVEKTFP